MPGDGARSKPRTVSPGFYRSINMPTPRYFLRNHAFLCTTVRHGVILDVHSDEYLCIDKRVFEALGPWLEGWRSSVTPRHQRMDSIPDDASTLAVLLLNKNVLSETPDGAKPVQPSKLATPTSRLHVPMAPTSAKESARYLLPFLFASAKADWRLRKQELQSTVHMVQERTAASRNKNTPFNYRQASTLVAAFERLRLLYPRPYLCMFDSLALLEFLAIHKLYPQWIFGVAVDPFLAHCWLQDRTTVINDTLERVGKYTPIMSV